MLKHEYSQVRRVRRKFPVTLTHAKGPGAALKQMIDLAWGIDQRAERQREKAQEVTVLASRVVAKLKAQLRQQAAALREKDREIAQLKATRAVPAAALAGLPTPLPAGGIVIVMSPQNVR